MTKEHKISLANHLSECLDLFATNITHISVLLSKEELEYVIRQVHEHTEPTYEEVEDYCKARELSLITNELLAELIGRGK